MLARSALRHHGTSQNACIDRTAVPGALAGLGQVQQMLQRAQLLVDARAAPEGRINQHYYPRHHVEPLRQLPERADRRQRRAARLVLGHNPASIARLRSVYYERTAVKDGSGGAAPQRAQMAATGCLAATNVQ